MCGLVGFSSPNNYNLDKIKLLLFWNMVERGIDATGIFTPKTGIVKDNTKAAVFINNKTHMSKVKADNTLIGHVRAKTIGGNTVANAHPFNYGSIYGSHNGSLTNPWSLCKDYDFKAADYDVDSQVIMSSINEDWKKGIEKPSILEKYEGAAALLYFNTDTNTLYACHDNKRPLFYGYDGVDMYISSIRESLTMIGCETTFEFDVNQLYSIRNGEILTKTPYKPYTPPTVLETIIKMAKDIIIRDNKLILPPHITGFAYSTFKVGYAEGFWLRAKSTTSYTGSRDQDRLAIIRDNWYYIVKPDKINNYDVLVEDEFGNEGYVYMSLLDHENFIPTKGNYVVSLKNTYHNIKGMKVPATIKGDLYKVVDYKYGDDEILVRDEYAETNWRVSMHLIRVAMDNEIAFHKECLKQVFEPIMQPEINFDKPNDLPFDVPEVPKSDEKDVKQLEPVKNEEDKVPDTDETPEEYISFDAHQASIEKLEESVKDIKLKYGANEDITTELNQLESDILNSYDLIYLENLVESSSLKGLNKSCGC